MAGSGLSGSSHSSAVGCQPLELELDVPAVLGRDGADRIRGQVGLLALAGVDEHVLALAGDDQPLAERGLQVLAQLLGLEPLGQGVRGAVVDQAHRQSPVIAHGSEGI